MDRLDRSLSLPPRVAVDYSQFTASPTGHVQEASVTQTPDLNLPFNWKPTGDDVDDDAIVYWNGYIMGLPGAENLAAELTCRT